MRHRLMIMIEVFALTIGKVFHVPVATIFCDRDALVVIAYYGHL
jgi:hypothetical protein